MIDVTHVSPCYAWRDQRAHETDGGYVARLARNWKTISPTGRGRGHGRHRQTRRRATAGACPP